MSKLALLSSVIVFVATLLSCNHPQRQINAANAETPDASTGQQALLTQNLVIPERRDFPVNVKLDPCNDFYEYACSGALADFSLPDDKSAYTFAFNDSHERVKRKKMAFIDSVANKKVSPRLAQVRDVYQSCLNEKRQVTDEQEWVAQVKADLAQINSHEELAQYIVQRWNAGSPSFLGLGDIPNQKNSLKNDAYFDVDVMQLNHRKLYEKEDVKQAYTELVSAFLITIGETQQISARAKKVVDLEQAFSQVYPTPEEFRALINEDRYVSRESLVAKYPAFHLDQVFAPLSASVPLRDLSPEATAYLHEQFVKGDLQTLKDLVAVQSLYSTLDDAYPEFYDQKFQFSHKYLGGPAVRKPRDQRCADYTFRKFAKEIDADMVQEMFPDFSKEKFVALLEKVRKEMIHRIKSNEWLSDAGRKGALKKMERLGYQVVTPNTEAEWDFLPVKTYDNASFLNNVVIFNKMMIEKTYDDLSKDRNKDVWGMGPLTVNAYYSAMDNKFVMPIGILQYPFYDQNLPEHVNMGAVGVVVGHEIGHAIDDKGAQYDGDGALNNWMTEEDLKHFKEMGQKLGVYYAAEEHNPELTMGENIGDLSGLTFAYDAAFGKKAATQKQKQEFFLQYARAWCQSIRPKFREQMLRNDYHSQQPQRVNLPIKHLTGFYEAYQCKAGDNMYVAPKDRVQIW
ncbi:MAG: M13 family metallopeptidase [Pseudobdellovibrionaceae bacterium]|nr:M13 family metallopeptidase [Bdellovibrionales bacterium]USN47454.1 MAG: M13 family metallopeptidase [Pseudobdellovibrionaceae bacterium]